MAVPVTLAIIAALIAGWAANHLYQMAQNMTARLVDTEKRISQLEQAQAKHLPYKTADEIENATAALLYVKQAADLRNDMIDNCLAHLQKARQGNKK